MQTGARLTASVYSLPAALPGPENPLPMFRHRRRPGRRLRFEELPPGDRERIGWETSFRVLPYRMQDDLSRDLRPTQFRSVTLENGLLRAEFLPEMGGRLVSLRSLEDGRELVERNRILQTANLALRGAWFSGGIEWNASHPGHHYLTCSPVFAARAPAPGGGPALRLYEWDCVKGLTWQLDFWLPEGSRRLFVHVRLVNPHPFELPAYWWTNIALPEIPDGRVICPARSAILGSGGALRLVDVPRAGDVDLSRPAMAPFAQEVFFRVPEGSRPWIAQADSEGHCFVQTSTRRLRGRKLFAWGQSPGGRRWQEYLGGPGSAYIEVQAGLARTQLECVPMPAQETWSWTEAFGSLHVDPSLAHSEDWSQAVSEVGCRLEESLPEGELEYVHAALEETSRMPCQELLARGSGWGALERERCRISGQPCGIPASLWFPEDSMGLDQDPWRELLRTGILPERPPQEEPGHYMAQAEWREALERSVRGRKGRHWLSLLHLGVARMEGGDSRGARSAWKRSAEETPTGWAFRNLAVLEQRARRPDAALELMWRAWECGPRIPALALELGRLLQRQGCAEELREFCRSLPTDVASNERVQLMAARAALATGHEEELNGFFECEFATIREGEVTLTDLWFEWQAWKIARREGRIPDRALRLRLRRTLQPPAHLDFRLSPEADEG